VTRTRPSQRAHLDAIVEHLTSGALGPVGDGVKPVEHQGSAKPGWQGAPGTSAFTAWTAVYLIDLVLDGPLSDGDTDAELVIQTTSVGATRAQAQSTADLVAERILNTAIVVPGRTVVHVEHHSSGGVQREDDLTPPEFSAINRWSISTTPT
jgi:hypothetical protein